jgi:hypothetical protein
MADRINRMPSDKTEAPSAATPLYAEKMKLPGGVAFGEATLRKNPSAGNGYAQASDADGPSRSRDRSGEQLANQRENDKNSRVSMARSKEALPNGILKVGLVAAGRI